MNLAAPEIKFLFGLLWPFQSGLTEFHHKYFNITRWMRLEKDNSTNTLVAIREDHSPTNWCKSIFFKGDDGEKGDRGADGDKVRCQNKDF